MAKPKDPEMQAMQTIQTALEGDDKTEALEDDVRDRVISWINSRWNAETQDFSNNGSTPHEYA